MILYTAETCPKCKVIKKKLNDAGIEYEICQDLDKLAELADKYGIRTLPILEIEEGNLLDFSHILDYIKEVSQ